MDVKEPRPHTGIAETNARSEAVVREYQIAIEGMHLVRERLADCVRHEGVNQFVNCKELREQYWALCNDRYRGMVFPEGAEPKNRNVPGNNIYFYFHKLFLSNYSSSGLFPPGK